MAQQPANGKPLARVVEFAAYPAQCFFVALAEVAAAVALVFLAFHPDFCLNDDFTLQAILDGSVSGAPDAHTIYMNWLFSLPLAWLFAGAPGAPWLFVALEGANILALVAVGYVFLRAGFLQGGCARASRRAAVAWLAGPFVLSLCMGVFSVAHADYTTAAALLAGAGCSAAALAAYLAVSDGGARCVERVVLAAVAGLFVGGAYLVRSECGLVGAAFLGVVVCAFLAGSRAFGQAHVGGREMLSLAVPLALACLVGAAGYLAQAQAYSSDEWADFQAFNEVRTAYTDYGHVNYEGNEELFAQYGWDKTLYDLSRSWFLMDDRMTAEAFDAFTRGGTISSPVNLVGAFVGDTSAFVRFALCALMCLNAALCAVCVGRRGWRSAPSLAACLCFAAMIALIGYLAASGRFVFRAACCALFPSVLVGLACACLPTAAPALAQAQQGSRTAYATPAREGKPFSTAGRVVAALFGLACLAVGAALAVAKSVNVGMAIVGAGAFLAVAIAYARRSPARERLAACAVAGLIVMVGAASAVDTVRVAHANESTSASAQAMYDYAAEHPDDVFVYVAGICSTQPWAKQPANTKCWGGWNCRAPFNALADAKLGHEDGINGASLLEDDVYFVTRSGEPKLLLAYLSDISGGKVSYTLVDSPGAGIQVYAFGRA